MKNRLTAALAACVVAAGAAASFAAASPQHPAGNVVRISAVSSGLAYNTKVLHAKAGMVTIAFTNLSPLHHNVRLEIGEKEYGGTKTIGHGSTTVTVKLSKGHVSLLLLGAGPRGRRHVRAPDRLLGTRRLRGPARAGPRQPIRSSTTGATGGRARRPRSCAHVRGTCRPSPARRPPGSPRCS